MDNTFIIAFLISILMLLITFEITNAIRGRKREKLRDNLIRTLQDNVRALCAGASGVGNHLDTVEQKLRRLAERQNQMDMRDQTTHTYGHAIKLVQRGANLEDIMENCGLPRGEAELLLNLHRSGATQN